MHIGEDPYVTMLIDEMYPSLFIHIIFGNNGSISPNNEKNGTIIDKVLSSLKNKYPVNAVCDSGHYIQHEQPEQLDKLTFDLCLTFTLYIPLVKERLRSKVSSSINL